MFKGLSAQAESTSLSSPLLLYASLISGELKLGSSVEAWEQVRLHSSSLRGVARRWARSSQHLYWQCFPQFCTSPSGYAPKGRVIPFPFCTCTFTTLGLVLDLYVVLDFFLY
ncbi:hypothetical protein Taro_010247 [Colocasia esculenta]|uniref:Uncharacterized protein n=1 Tax=Colocasia esculenta TaxID=4460 RepID=A0A843U6D5_COLES|nr:hypothetical protein [Colocasia esculenta]